MAVDAGLTIRLKENMSYRLVLQAMLNSSWGASSVGKMAILSTEDDAFEWTEVDEEPYDRLVAFVELKHTADEVAGLRLWWDRGERGADFLLYRDRTIIVSPIGRPVLEDKVTDVTWYLSRLLPLWELESGFAVVSWCWTEVY